jgi:hypothetical protein
VTVVEHPLAHSQLSEEAELQLALALSLSASLGGGTGTQGRSRAESDAHRLPPRPPRRRGAAANGVDAELLTYEALVELEDVRLTASQECVDELPVLAFDPGDAHGDAGACCSICQELYTDGDQLIHLPCGHVMHTRCGREYLLNWSKKCPECKRSAAGD